ncbi:MAG: carboxypeptidase regulatory-like domain-containing protein [Coriobacteriia bacterium]|nr:carboxypeptidase regulatory-like domain-containing protein [Coriobacteriia bacterium]
MRRLGLALLALALCASATACTLKSCSDGGKTGGGQHDAETTVELRGSKPVRFVHGGETHTARLLRVEGGSAEVEVSSSPVVLVLTEGASVAADLDGDSLPEAAVGAASVEPRRVTMTVSNLDTPAYDETGFETTGGVAPAGMHDWQMIDPAGVGLDDGGVLLLYAGGPGRSVFWERYRADGTQPRAPRFEGGRLAWPRLKAGQGDVLDPIDAVRIGGSLVVSFRSGKAVWLARYDLASLAPEGPPVFASASRDHAGLATDGAKRVWLVGTTPTNSGPRASAAVSITEFAHGKPPIMRTAFAVTSPPGGNRDWACDLAYDARTGRLAALYVRVSRADARNASLRLAVVDPKAERTLEDLEVARLDITQGVGSAPAVGAAGGTALVFWLAGGTPIQHLAAVDLAQGSVRKRWDGTGRGRGAFQDFIDDADTDFVAFGSGLALLYPDRSIGGPDAPLQDRFALQPIGPDGPIGERLVLDGGQPVLPDLLFDPPRIRANPVKAVCGSPCLLTGAVTNRGSQDARGVRLAVTVDGNAIGTLDLGTVKAGDTVTFAKVWDVPPDFADESAEVRCSLSSDTAQYTTGNDVCTARVQVRQKGVVQGRVTDASGLEDRTFWAPGLGGVAVSFGGKTVLTDAAGFFAIEEVDFGSGTLTASKDGYNPVSLRVETSRTKPIASVGVRMDDHGKLTIRTLDASGKPLPGVQALLVDHAVLKTTDADGELLLDAPKGRYRIAFRKQGYRRVPPQAFEVVLGQERSATVTLEEATTGSIAGLVVGRTSAGVAGASVTVRNGSGEVAAQLTTDQEGRFATGELPIKPDARYTVTASGNGMEVTEAVTLVGGEAVPIVVELVPGRGTLKERAATEGYTSWMIKAGWPGFLDVGGQSIYVWFGNYAIRVCARYWDGNRDLDAVSVSTWGGTYETHVTKGEIEFDVSGDDLIGGKPKPLPPPMAKATDAKDLPWWKRAGKAVYGFYEEHKDDFNLGKEVILGAKKVRDAWTDDDEWIVLGQGPALLTWKQALDDFDMSPELDWRHPIESAKSVKKAIPTSFAIPIVIGGSSVQDTAVRVDGIDVVDSESGEVVLSDRRQWYDDDDPDETGCTTKTLLADRQGIAADRIRVLVWVTVQKRYAGDLTGTCFYQRQKQVVVFEPGRGAMQAYVAPGDTYQDPSWWTTARIAALVGE